MSETEILSEFKRQMITFFDELIAQFPQEGDLIIMRLFITNQMPIMDVINEFNYEVNKNKGEKRQVIKDRNETYFLQCDVTPETHDKYKFSHFRKLWLSGVLDSEDKRIIWQWIDTFVFLVDKWNKCTQQQN